MNVVQLTSSNIDSIVAKNELVIINFYAEWCRFSSLLAPVLEEAANEIAQAFPEPDIVVFGKVDCDQESAISKKFCISKFPTVKAIVNGKLARGEYRGKRSVEAFVSFVKKQLENPIQEFNDLSEIEISDIYEKVITGYFNSKNDSEYNVFRKAATALKEHCKFYVGFCDAVHPMFLTRQSQVLFGPVNATPEVEHEIYDGSFVVYDELHAWLTDKCVPLIRQLTTENTDNIVDEQLPFLILYHRPDDIETIKFFEEIVKTHLISERQNINFLTADGEKFPYMLRHLDKTVQDLPVIGIGYIADMYVIPTISDLKHPGKLKQFMEDLHSGKLYREKQSSRSISRYSRSGNGRN